MIRQWKKVLVENAGAWRAPQGEDWKFLFHNNYHPHCSNINLLWFHGKSRFPQVVTKLHREPDILRREHENLSRAHACAPSWVPRPLCFERQGSFWALWMEAAPGFRYPRQGPHSTERLCSMTDMVVSLHKALAGSAIEGEGRYERLVGAPLAAVAGFGNSAIVKEGCARLAKRFSQQAIAALPVIPQHGDLFSDNLLTDGAQWHVIDWESFGTIDLPFYDLLTLLLSLLGAMEKPPERWDKPLVRQMPALIETYACALALPLDAITLVLPLTLVNWFHLQWADGRKLFSDIMYRTLENYFQDPDVWERAFLRA
jgi:aminoglycoside phosphotransferase (APT) family kinase protein